MQESALKALLSKNPHLKVSVSAGSEWPNLPAGASQNPISHYHPCDGSGVYRKTPEKRSRKVEATEHQEQVSFWQYVEAVIIPAWPEAASGYAIPNGARTSPAQAGKLKAEGLRAGVFDTCFPIARHGYHGLYIEMKRRSGGRTSAEQRAFQVLVTDQGYRAAICCGWEAAAAELRAYLEN